jgi:hypothetical protein
VRAPLPDQSHNDADVTRAQECTLDVADFLHDHFYGRSRVPSLTALLQRQFRPAPPLPFRRDSLLINQPDWFESRVDELMQTRRRLEADEELEQLRNAVRDLQEQLAALAAAR